MSIDTIFILSQNGQILAHRIFKGLKRKDTLPEFYTQFIQYFRGTNADKEYPIIRIKDALYPFVTFSEFIIGAIVTEEIPILQLFATLFLILDVLKASFPNESYESLKQNLPSILIMLDTLFDYGYPQITQRYALESIVKPRSLIQKIKEKVIGRQNLQKETVSVMDSYIESQADMNEYSQYRIPEIKGQEEVYFDVIEYLNCVLDKNGRILMEEINGEIKVDCNLSGIPELYVFLNQPKQFDDYSVHECLLQKIDTFEREQVLVFVPPSGTTTIFYYNIKEISIRVPFDFIPKLQFLNNQVKIDLPFQNRPVRDISYVVDELHVKLTVPTGLSLGETEMVQGTLQELENAILWKIGKLEIDSSIRLAVTFTAKEELFNIIQQGNFLVQLKFVVKTFSSSQTKIDKVEVKNGPKVLIKRARNIAKSGYYEIRLN
ncbi:unnamed protein product (macronuclear) [Paramecium tetraurelia]|uniref:MHD domain-containing protein n=1 Tax=Paramecium tetraurelia TaxID=5888 RepID=A0E8M5_PARTE|nr:uncharacterized protein GSPATT00024371001 [Paramecium tetraurelia]CAK91642.1 unnamed protein product [Paramecium tetraurelia]|eukprot:XP_001459039.1 hypothetical protein (macronuclear) [Paramecium tetraurelia strain d4-2]